MSTHLQRDISTLHNDLLSMYAIVEEMIQIAVDGLARPSRDIAETLRKRDNDIDSWDVRIEDECLKVLALHQPVARELRRVTSVLKITGELERVADLSVNIAKRTIDTMYTEVDVPAALQRMANIATGLLRRSITAYIELDADLARQVCEEDETVDTLNKQLLAEFVAHMKQSPHLIEPLTHLFTATRHLERVGDHATNIAEDVVYLVEGEIIRHGKISVHSESPPASARLPEPLSPSHSPSKGIVSIHGIEIDRIGHGARIDGRELTLTLTEFKMLWTLASQPGRVFSRQELLDVSRGDDANALERTIDVHVRSLRKKLGEKAELINTVRGVGYRMLIDSPARC